MVMMQVNPLLTAAMVLPIPTSMDFTTAKAPVGGVSSERLRIVTDPRLREKLVSRGMAEALQVRRGPQDKVIRIMLLYPEGNALRRKPEEISIAAPRSATPVALTALVPGATVASGPRRSLPTVEAISRLIEKLRGL